MCICILNIVLKFGGNWLRESIFMVKFSMFVYLLPALYIDHRRGLGKTDWKFPAFGKRETHADVAVG
jgi:hypothetical protein